MPKSPKEIEEKMLRVLDSWKTLAPAKTFGGMTLEQFEEQVNKSLAPRRRLIQIEDERMLEQTLREAEDYMTMNCIQMVVNGVLADPTEGPNSALYEAMGYVRKDARKSGLTRKRTAPAAKAE